MQRLNIEKLRLAFYMELSLALCLLLFFVITASAIDTIAPGQSIKDGETLVSAGGSFELGFFSPERSRNRYLGVWYKKVPTRTVVWVGNREAPVSDQLGVLSFSDQGVLALLNSTRSIVWCSNTSRTARSPVARLLESGNFVVKDGNESDQDNFLWQSFDYPCDNFLPGMKLGRDLVTGFERYVSSWKNIDDPAQGEYSLRLDPHGVPQIVVRKGSELVFRSGTWNGAYFFGRKPNLKPGTLFSYQLVLNKKETYYKYELRNHSVVLRYAMNLEGLMQLFVWNDRKHDWQMFGTPMSDQCGSYASCGAYAACTTNPQSPPCPCLEGFVPKSQAFGDRNTVDWSDGCMRRTPLVCDGGDGFLKQNLLKFPDTSRAWANNTMNLKDCHELCSRNCSCTAYANLNPREGTGCLVWFSELIDMTESGMDGLDLYIRLAASDLARIRRKMKLKQKQEALVIAISILVAAGIIVLVVALYIQRKKLRKKDRDKEEVELPIFDLSTIANATNNFSSNNKLGQGGFGQVYKGMLIEGQEIAVKRLSKNSTLGLEQFKNEVTVIAKLQHRNLVKLLGCCIKGDERMLVYEYMPNRSLDYFIFDKTRGKLLDWHRRKHIVDGIARGLLYLHHDSRLRIIHRDLKASNILLDSNMNPKISDFGLARMCSGDQTSDRTRRVVGTYGYMSPEYAFHGRFSVKSDVFSFGVLILEIMTGKKSRGYSGNDHNLLVHAWRLWREERPVELIDTALRDSCITAQALRCINVALLCVQQQPDDRPNMPSVLLMLGGESTLPQPNQPGYFIDQNLPASQCLSNKHESQSNEVTITLLEPR